MTDQTRFDLTRRSTFQLFTPVTIRFCDTDMLGHINNVSIASYFEAARCELFYRLMHDGGMSKRGSGHERIDFVLANVSINFKRELHYPGSVEVGARFTKLGNRSITTGYGLFVGEICHATAESVNVFFDLDSRKPVAPPESVRELIEKAVAA